MKMTNKRCNGIKDGYWSAQKKEPLVQKLGAIEHIAPGLLGRVCDDCCRYPREIRGEDILEGISRMVTGAGNVTATCYEEKPGVSLPVQLVGCK